MSRGHRSSLRHLRGRVFSVEADRKWMTQSKVIILSVGLFYLGKMFWALKQQDPVLHLKDLSVFLLWDNEWERWAFCSFPLAFSARVIRWLVTGNISCFHPFYRVIFFLIVFRLGFGNLNFLQIFFCLKLYQVISWSLIHYINYIVLCETKRGLLLLK